MQLETMLERLAISDIQTNNVQDDFVLFISINTSSLKIYPLVSSEVTLIKSVGSSVKQGDLLVQIDNTQAKF